MSASTVKCHVSEKDMLTAGKDYEVLAYDPTVVSLQIKDDCGRERWFSIERFVGSIKDVPKFQLFKKPVVKKPRSKVP